MGTFYFATLSRIRHGLFYVCNNGKTVAIGPRFKTEQEMREFATDFFRDAAEKYDEVKP